MSRGGIPPCIPDRSRRVICRFRQLWADRSCRHLRQEIVFACLLIEPAADTLRRLLMPQDFSEDDWIYACHTFRGFRVFIHGGLYVPGECGTIPLSSVERLVIVRKGRHSKGRLYTNVSTRRRGPMPSSSPGRRLLAASRA